MDVDTAYVYDVDETSFEEAVLRRSYETPVVVDLWAAWCGPCRVLGPVLERLAAEAAGAWVLAKLDVDANQALAAAFGVQGIPAVRAFRDGRQVAEFVGALPEDQVRAWLRQLGPSPADVAVSDGRAAAARGDLAGAAELFRRALGEEPGHGEARTELAGVELKLRSSGSNEAALRARLDAHPNDVEAATALADVQAAAGDLQEAFTTLLETVRMTSGDERERARVHLLSLLDTIPPDDPRAMSARRSLALALF